MIIKIKLHARICVGFGLGRDELNVRGSGFQFLSRPTISELLSPKPQSFFSEVNMNDAGIVKPLRVRK